jgi:hypothetical protein
MKAPRAHCSFVSESGLGSEIFRRGSSEHRRANFVERSYIHGVAFQSFNRKIRASS